MQTHLNNFRTRAGLSTNALAEAIGAKPGPIRTRLCQTGSYYGIKPQRLPNRRLLWPADSVERLLNQKQEATA